MGKIAFRPALHEWSRAVRAGKLTAALRSLNPQKKTGPWTILCDGETFLRAKVSMAAYGPRKIKLWDVPAKSPDLNPVEMFWSWLRRKLRLMDLADLRNKRQILGKTAYTMRVKKVMKSQKAQTVAKNYAKRFRKTCQRVASSCRMCSDTLLDSVTARESQGDTTRKYHCGVTKVFPRMIYHVFHHRPLSPVDSSSKIPRSAE